MTALIIIGGIAVYLAIGLGWVAPRYITHAVANYIRRFPTLAGNPGRIEQWRREEAGLSLPIAFVWPLYLVGRLLLNWIAGASPPTSYELKILSDQQARHIAELEEQLGMGKPR